VSLVTLFVARAGETLNLLDSIKIFCSLRWACDHFWRLNVFPYLHQVTMMGGAGYSNDALHRERLMLSVDRG
jgi:hypothetical protein